MNLKSLFNSCSALAKGMLLWRVPSPKSRAKSNSVIVMGNGPSLRDAIDNHRPWLEAHDLIAVNFAANTPDFFSLRPQYYVLADPHFFVNFDKDPNVAKLWDNLSNADWPVSLWIPAKSKGMLADLKRRGVSLPASLTVKFFNLTPADGYSPFLGKLFDAGMVMPRPRNVLIPAIMTAIREGYKEIFLAGADHSWTKTLWVDDDNRVVSVQPHFYKDSDKELKRVASDYQGLHISDVLGSMTIAFRSYLALRQYAEARGIRIYNSTPGSFIDAFPRRYDFDAVPQNK
ncbi:MAG: hypothetical protein NC328_07660 [Muribaculum sp.]|nr:hypothetical protein [Muribaculum sp.]